MAAFIVISPEEFEQLISQKLDEKLAPLMKLITGPKNAIEKEWITRSEYAKKYSISVSMVDKLKREGRLEYKKVGSKVLLKNCFIKEY